MPRVITEELTGEHSFRGAGVIEVNGILSAFVGSKKFNFGRNGRVRYFEEHLKRVPPETEFNGFLKVAYTQGSGCLINNGVRYNETEYEGIPFGMINTGWQIVKFVPGIKIVHTSTGVNLLNDPDQLPDAVALDGQQFYITSE